VIVGLIGVITIVAGVAAVVIIVLMNRGVFTPPMPDTPSVAEAPPTAAPSEVPPTTQPEAETPAPREGRVPDPTTPAPPPEREAEAPVVAPGAADEPRAPRERTRPRAEVASEGEDRGEAAQRRQPLRVGGTIPQPTKLRDVRPVYPPIAIAARVQGVVIIEATIDRDGKVSDARVLRSIPLLDQAALDAVRQWEYTPTRVHGEAVPVIMTVTANFTLR
jgi:protein TonB